MGVPLTLTDMTQSWGTEGIALVVRDSAVPVDSPLSLSIKVAYYPLVWGETLKSSPVSIFTPLIANTAICKALSDFHKSKFPQSSPQQPAFFQQPPPAIEALLQFINNFHFINDHISCTLLLNKLLCFQSSALISDSLTCEVQYMQIRCVYGDLHYWSVYSLAMIAYM